MRQIEAKFMKKIRKIQKEKKIKESKNKKIMPERPIRVDSLVQK